MVRLPRCSQPSNAPLDPAAASHPVPQRIRAVVPPSSPAQPVTSQGSARPKAYGTHAPLATKSNTVGLSV